MPTNNNESTTYHRMMNGQIERARDGNGQSLPQGFLPQVIRSFRSKHQPHFGAKQKSKAVLAGL